MELCSTQINGKKKIIEKKLTNHITAGLQNLSVYTTDKNCTGQNLKLAYES